MRFDLFTATDPAFQPLASNRKVPSVEPLPVSSWVAMSAMQKAIRRGDVDLATRAAATLLRSDPARLWRRLAGIVVEDVGLASVDTIRLVVAATTSKSLREGFGGEWAVASMLVEHMAISPKDRATDDLLWTIAQHHELDELRASLASVDLSEHLSRIRERGALLGASLSVLHASGVRWDGQVAGKTANAAATFDAIRVAGVDPEIVALAEQGFRKTREVLPVLLPLLTLAMPSGVLPAQDDEFPKVVIGRNGLPTYVYDAFSWEGKSALSRFLKQNTVTGRWLRRYVPAERRMVVLAGGLFRVEGGLVRQRVDWPCAATLKWLADAGYHQMKLPDPAGLLSMIRNDLPLLDEVRHEL